MSFMEFRDSEVGIIPRHWDIVKLDELVDVIDSLHKTPKYVNIGIPMIRVKDLYEGYFNISTPVYVTEEVYEEFSKKHKPKYGDILFSRVGSYGITSYVISREKFCLGQNTVVITNYDEAINCKYLYYNMISSSVKNQIEMSVTGSTQKTISLKSIRGFNITLPPIQEQKAIAHILSTLDEKIETKNQINKKLEEMAQAIFKHWFVDFEFPNEDGEPYKSSGGEMVESELGMIPKGWEVRELHDISVMKNGVNYGRDQEGEEVKIINVRDFENNLILNKSKLDSIFLPQRQIDDYLLDIYDTVVVRSARPGETLLVFDDREVVYSGFTIRVRANKKLLRLFVFFSIRNSIQILNNSSNGTIFKNLNQKILGSLKVVIPNENIIKSYNGLVKDQLDLINNNIIEINNITNLRDTLLPKLMSGEIRVQLEDGDIS